MRENSSIILESQVAREDPMAATFGTLPELGNFLISGYWASPAGGGTMPRQWQSNSISVNITGLTSAEQTLAQDALADWAAVANLTFTFTSGPALLTYLDTGPLAFETDTRSGQFLTSATVNIASNFAPIGPGPDGVGSYLFQTYIHETGHALGLGHEGPYNGAATYSPNGPPAGNNIFTNDTWQWSVMSYNQQQNVAPSTFAFVVTPQMADIFAIQQMYGPPTPSVGNTTYGFNSTASSIYNFALYPQGNPAAVPAFTIYNTGANNTLNDSGYNTNDTINLNQGTWSSIGGQVNNIGIYTTTNIANAVAGSGNDLIIPNGSLTQKGTLTGGSGNDTFQGTQAGLSQYTIANMHVGDKIYFTDANLPFAFNLTGSTLNYGNNNQITITFLNNQAGKFVASADPAGGVDLTIAPANSPLSSPPPVSVGALISLQQGIQFSTDTAQATAQAALINATPTTTSVFTYAASLIMGQSSLAQVAMADSALMEGGTIAPGNTTTPNTLAFFSRVFLPGQVTFAMAQGLNPTVVAAEALGLVLGGDTNFNTNFVTPFATNVLGFAQAVSNATGTNVTAIQNFVNHWTAFYTANPSAIQGLTVTQAAYGAAFGDAVGAALAAPTSLNLPLTTVFSTTGNNGFSPNTVTGLVANALINIAEDTANGTPGTLYKTGVSLVALPQHARLQGEFNGGIEQVPIGNSSQSNSTVNGTLGAGQGDTITAAAGTTGQVSNFTGTAAPLAVLSTSPPSARKTRLRGFRRQMSQLWVKPSKATLPPQVLKVPGLA
jgi:hypothetical protein